MRRNVVAVIFARGGSKGVPRKNLRELAGMPLLGHAISTARQSNLIDRVVVSTDDHEIADVGRRFGADVPFIRPKELAEDDTPEWLAWQHAIRTLDSQSEVPMNLFVSVPTTSPLRAVDDLDACINEALKGNADVVITACPSSRNPYFNMVRLDEKGYARLLIDADTQYQRRQDSPPVHNITTVAYAANPTYVLSASHLFQGRVKAVLVPQVRALDIDSDLDLLVAECLFSHRAAEPLQ